MLGILVSAPDTAGGRLNVPIAALHTKPRGRPDRTGREALQGAQVRETSEDAPHGLVVQGVWRDRLAQEPCGLLLGTDRCQAVEGAAATERSSHEAPHARAGVHVPLRGPIVLEEAHEAQLVGVGVDHGPMVDGVDLDRGR